MRDNRTDYIEPTQNSGKVLPRVYDRASVPKYTEKGNIHAFAILADKNAPPPEWDVSMPSHKKGKRWYWLFLLFAAALLFWPQIAGLL